MTDLSKGLFIRDDFLDLPTGKYTATQATAGTFALTDYEYGAALADCNSTTAAQGINVQLGGTAGEFVKPQAGVNIWFEARLKIADTATGPELFVGLHETDTTIIASSALSGSNMIGFSSVTDDNVVLFTGEKATAADSNACTTLVDDTWIHLGFKVTGVTKTEQYVNGVKQAASTNHATANIPILELRPSFVCHSGGTTDPILWLDWWQLAVQYT
jgi:hypothetical protein